MLRISADAAPRELELPHGVTFTVRPARSDIVIDAMAELRREGVELSDMEGAQRVVLAKALARRAVMSWTGVVDDTTGKAAPVAPEFVDAVLDDWQIFAAFEREYVLPLWQMVQEKNGSRSSRNGGSAGGGATARNAKGAAKGARRTSTRRKASKGS